MNKQKRILSLILALAMVLSLFPTSVFADTLPEDKEDRTPTIDLPDDITTKTPAQEFIYEDGKGLTVTVQAPVSAFPSGTQMTVKDVPLEEVQKLIDASDYTGLTAVLAEDISFTDAEGAEIQPAKEVTVSIVSTKVEVEDPVLLHIDDEGDIDVVNQEPDEPEDPVDDEPVMEPNAAKLAAADPDAFRVTFKAASFSTFTVTRSNGTSAKVHHGYISGGNFVEFPDGSSSNTNYPSTINSGSYNNSDNRFAYLIYDFPGYEYDSTHVGSATGDAIWPILRRTSSGSGYNAQNYWQTHGTGNNANWADYANNSDIYVVYRAKTISPGYTGGSDDDEPGATPDPSAFVPDIGKNVTAMKSDGTYDITLDVVGHKDTSEVKTVARVIVVFDISGSMDWRIDRYGPANNTTNPVRMTVAKNAVTTLANKLLNITDSSGNKLVEMGLVTFSTNAQRIQFSNQDFTNNPTTYNNAVDRLSADGGTNWEYALDIANAMAASQLGKTYIVFVSDGNPTFRISRGSYTDAQIQSEANGNNQGTYTYGATNRPPIFGSGQTGDTTTEDRCYDAAAIVAKSIVDNDKTLYTVGLSADAPRMSNLATAAGGKHYDGSNADAFATALETIAGAIESEIGLSDVVINDGVTDLSHIETQALIGTAGNFVYTQSYPLTASGTGYTYSIGNNTYNVTEAQVEAGQDANGHRIFSRVTNGVSTLYIEYPWDNAPEAEIQEDNSVKWDTSSASLEHGVVYSVTFTVWPKQEAYDLIADLNNGIKKISAQTDGIKEQLRVNIGGTVYEYDTASKKWMPGSLTDAQLEAAAGTTATYSMKTNTGLSATYKYGGVEGTHNYTNYVNGDMSLDTTTFSVLKDWQNLLPEDSRTAKWLEDENGNYIYEAPDGSWVTEVPDGANYPHVLYIDLIVTKEGGQYEEIRLTSNNADPSKAWRYDDIFISLGVLSVSNGKITVRETGHNYSIAEKPSDAYYWELTAYTYRPMVINGKKTMLQLIDEDDENYATVKDLADKTTTTIDGVTYYSFEGGVYKGIPLADAVLRAVNHRRSYLNITKVVEDTAAPEDALFELEITIDNPAGSHPDDAEYDADMDDYWFSVYEGNQIIMDLEVTGATAEIDRNGDPTGYWYAPNGATVTVKIKAGWNFRSMNLVSGTTYTIEEIGMEPGFEFGSIAATAVKDDENVSYSPTIDGATIEGEIEEPNTEYTVTYTNDYVGYFYVYHSSDNTIERIYLTDSRVKKATNGTRTFDIYAETKAGTLYGGYYEDYAGKSASFDETALTYTDGWSEDEDGTAYSYAYIKDSSMGAWDYSKAYDTIGTAMTPERDKVYYLKEVPTGYLMPYTQYTYYKIDNTLGSLWAISAVDDLNYENTGIVVGKTPKDATVRATMVIRPENGTAVTNLTADKVFRSKGVLAGYLTYVEITDTIGTKTELRQYWETKDGITVYGTKMRTLTYKATPPTYTDITKTDANYTPVSE